MSDNMKVFHSNNLEYLASLVSYIIKEHPLDNPFDEEQIIVQSSGMRDWINSRIAEELGISMQIRYSFPWAFVWQLLSNLGYNEETNPQQRFKLENMVWTIYSLLPELIADRENKCVPCFSSIYNYVVTDKLNIDHVKLFQLSQSIAKVFDGYMLYRTRWLQSTSDDLTVKAPCGYLENFDLYDDQKSIPIDSKINDQQALNLLWQGIGPERWKSLSKKHRLLIKNNMWQVVLWERILERNESDHHIANMIDRLIEDLQMKESLRNLLPRRIFVFGISSLPTKFLQLLKVLGNYIDVCYMFLNPCRQYWGCLSRKAFESLSGNKKETFAETLMRKVKTFPNFASDYDSRPIVDSSLLPDEFDGEEYPVTGNSLLLSWGKQGSDNLYNLLEAETDDTEVFENPWKSDDPSTHTVLNAIKSDIFSLSEIDPYKYLFNQKKKSSDRLFVYDEKNADGSFRMRHNLEIHRAYTPLREVETVYDALLSRFKKDKSLKPSDCIVMVPDINRYVPYIKAVFEPLLDENSSADRRKRAIPYLISDQTYQSESPFLNSITDLLKLYKLQLTPTFVMDMLNLEQIQKRYEISQEDLNQINEWIAKNNIRADYNELELMEYDPEDPQEVPVYNTWYRSFRRMVVGSMMSAGETYLTDVQPQTAIEGDDTYLLGRFKSYVDDLERLRIELIKIQDNPQGGLTAGEWKEFVIQNILERFFVINEDIEADTSVLEQFIEDLIDKFDNINPDYRINVSVFENYLLSSITDSKQYKQFVSGRVNFCSFLPMRSIPFRHIFLLGMNDGDFPKREQELGFDLMKNGYQFRGDRSDREDGRYMFLETLLSAKDSLYISYIGKNVHDKSEKNPSTLVSELEGYLARTFITVNTWNSISSTLNELEKQDACSLEEKQKLLLQLYNSYRKNSGELLNMIIIDDPIASRSNDNFIRPDNHDASSSARAEHEFYYQSFQDEWFQFAGKKHVSGDEEQQFENLSVIDEHQTADANDGLPNLSLSMKNLSDFMNDPTAEMLRRRFNIRSEYINDEELDYEPFSICQRDELIIKADRFKELKKLVSRKISREMLRPIKEYDPKTRIPVQTVCEVIWNNICSSDSEIAEWSNNYVNEIIYSGRAAVGVRGEKQASHERNSWSTFLVDISRLYDYEVVPKLIKLQFRIPDNLLPTEYHGKYPNGYLVSLEGTIDDLYEDSRRNLVYLKSNYAHNPEKFKRRAYVETLCLVAENIDFSYYITDYKQVFSGKNSSVYTLGFEKNINLAKKILESLIIEYIHGMQEYEPTVIVRAATNKKKNEFLYKEETIADWLMQLFENYSAVSTEQDDSAEENEQKDGRNGSAAGRFADYFSFEPDKTGKSDYSVKCLNRSVQNMIDQIPDYTDFNHLSAYIRNSVCEDKDKKFCEDFLNILLNYNAGNYIGDRSIEIYRDYSCFNFGILWRYLCNCFIYPSLLLVEKDENKQGKN